MAKLKRIVERTASIGSVLLLATSLAPGGQAIPKLELGKPIERELRGGDAHTYQVRLARGQCLHFVVDQRGIDVVVKIVGPDEKTKGVYDSPTGSQGSESVWFLAEESGDYQLEVRSYEKTAAAGHYEARVEELRIATPTDKSRVAAHQAYAEGLQLSDPGKPDLLGRALEKYEAALALWRTAGDRAGEASAFFMIGAVYAALRERELALDFFHRNLRFERDLGNRFGEARALTNIGGVYESLGEKDEALKAYDQALALWRAIGASQQEAEILRQMAKLRGNR